MNAWFRRRAPAVMGHASTARSHVGRVRTVNEDRFLDSPDRALWAIADGMGGHRGGDVAAEIAIRHLEAIAGAPDDAALGHAIAAASDEIRRTTEGESGTTLVALHIDGDLATLHWAGDSRAYLVRGDALTPLTRDHSLVQQMVDAGALSPEQAAHHPRANVITSALGIGDAMTVDRTETRLRAGDRLLLCSDGLSRSLCDRDVRSDDSIEMLADRLLTNALQRDGSDNISLVLIEIA